MTKLSALHHKSKTPRNNEEERIQRAIHQRLMLEAPKTVWWCAVPNGEARSKATAGRLKAQGVVAGAPDIVLCIAGRFYGLELKADKGRQSENQIAQQMRIQQAAGVYAIARGIDEAYAILEAWGALSPRHDTMREAAE